MSAPLIIANILCGGRGSRIGGQKPLYNYQQKPLIAHVIEKLKGQCDEIILSLDAQENPILSELRNFGFHIVFDDPAFLGFGPMAGVLSGLEYVNSLEAQIQYVTAPCDMPNLPDDYVTKLLQNPNSSANYYKGKRDYPLCATIAGSILPILKAELSNCNGGLGAFRFLQSIDAKSIAIKNENQFLNINTPI